MNNHVLPNYGFNLIFNRFVYLFILFQKFFVRSLYVLITLEP